VARYLRFVHTKEKVDYHDHDHEEEEEEERGALCKNHDQVPVGVGDAGSCLLFSRYRKVWYSKVWYSKVWLSSVAT